MKKLIFIAIALLMLQNWGDIVDFFYAREAPADSNAKGVILYSTAWCGACKKTKDFLNRRGIVYTEYDVEKSDEGRRRFEALGGRGVPLLLINGTVVRGFNPGEMRRLLEF